MQELENAYRVLDLEPGASMEEVNQAYKDLVFIWHPDRLPKDNHRLIEKAQEKIKQLNQARDYLRTHVRVGTTAQNSNSNGYRARSRPYTRNYASSAYRSRSDYGRSPEAGTAHGGAPQRQPSENPYRAYQGRYAQSSYGSYGTYRSASDNTADHRSPTGSSQNGRAPEAGRQETRDRSETNGNNAHPNDGWNNYTTPRPGTSDTRYTRSPEREGASHDRSQSASYNAAPSESNGRYPNAYRTRQQSPDLSGSNLRGANLREKDFSGRNLSNSDLTGADLQDAFLHGVNLNRADLSNANLFRANLLQANLSHANLRGANLIGADLSGADLSGAKVAVGDRVMVKLTGTILRGTIMPDGTINT